MPDLNRVIENYHNGLTIWTRENVGVLVERIAELEAAKDAEWRKFVVMTHDERIMAMYRLWRDAADWASLWKRAAKKFYAKCQRKQYEIYDCEAMTNVQRLRAERAEAENAKLSQQVENIEGVLAMWQRQSDEANVYGSNLPTAFMRAAIADIKDALQAGAESGE